MQRDKIRYKQRNQHLYCNLANNEWLLNGPNNHQFLTESGVTALSVDGGPEGMHLFYCNTENFSSPGRHGLDREARLHVAVRHWMMYPKTVCADRHIRACLYVHIKDHRPTSPHRVSMADFIIGIHKSVYS
uniref:SCP domain-containing protein n=1 Tax=Panagrellus redivivus TaxID=6233 RepID=A0A7E4UZT2_PANRE